jgi:hypothetical protein
MIAPEPAVPPPTVPSIVVPEPVIPPPMQNAPEPVSMPAPIPSEAAGLRARFGNPDFIRREMDSELWRYDSQHCAVFFFMQRDGLILRLRYTETVPRGMNLAADPECLQQLDQRIQNVPSIMNPAAPPP